MEKAKKEDFIPADETMQELGIKEVDLEGALVEL